MGLELEHLKPYPIGKDGIIVNNPDTRGTYWIAALYATDMILVENDINAGTYEYRFDEVLPILYPKSDLLKYIEHNGESFVPYMRLDRLFDIDLDADLYYSVKAEDDGYHTINVFTNYQVVQKMLEWRLDLFGLIPKGIAIDVNTLPENPYK